MSSAQAAFFLALFKLNVCFEEQFETADSKHTDIDQAVLSNKTFLEQFVLPCDWHNNFCCYPLVGQFKAQSLFKKM